MDKKYKWIAFDLDATIAHYNDDKHDHTDYYNIGEPIPEMINLMKELLERGYFLSILTARMAPREDSYWSEDKVRITIENWLEKQGLPRLEVTCVKWPKFGKIFDDKAVSVIPNKGLFIRSNDIFSKLC